jgi:drug/metabolite transporter (DMT)-like permease
MKTETTGNVKTPPTWLVVAAFATVYILWGSTYLGIRFAIESIPPFLMAGSRCLAAGILLFGFVLLRGTPMPTFAQWRDASVLGFLLLGVGNGGLTWSEKYIPSGMAAVLVALTPLWMVLFDWMSPNGVRPKSYVFGGLAVGFVGVALLAQGDEHHSGPAFGWSVIVLMLSSIGWSFGSIYTRRANRPASPLLGIAMQFLTGGVVLIVTSLLLGEMKGFSLSQVTSRSLGAWLYLLTAGSLVGYTAYVWILQVSTPARVSTYAYVNPLIAVMLGCTLGGETFSREMIIASCLIILAVVLIVTGGARKPAKTPVAK